MPMFSIYRQMTPTTLVAPSKHAEGEYRAALMRVDDVRADDAEEAMAIARDEYGLLAPVVARVVH